jgi:glycosyltransferase involved in cell wall biosynthesis
MAGLAGSQAGGKTQTIPRSAQKNGIISRARSLFLSARYFLGPLTLPLYAGRFRKLVLDSQPDLVHALRIPFEGMLASYTPVGIPLVVSIWGNDLTLHASGSPWMKSHTINTLKRAGGLMAETQRDLRLGVQWGFPKERPAVVLPGGGGIDLVEMYQLRTRNLDEPVKFLPATLPLVINPRGFRPGSVRNDVFFQAARLVLERQPNVAFICPAMAGQVEALRWVTRLKLQDQVILRPYLPQAQLWDLFVRSQISISISEHDGTPNSLLEAMACGCFPIAGDIESLREWITPGVNGMLVEPRKPQSLAEAILLALDNPELRSTAAEINMGLIRKRAEASFVRSQVEVFYNRLVGSRTTTRP